MSYAGRRTLIQSTLNSIPIITMQSDMLPVAVCDRLAQCNGKNGEADNSHGHLLSWERLCRPKGNGGLGLRKARNSNVAFLAKTGCKLKIREYVHGNFSEEILKGAAFS